MCSTTTGAWGAPSICKLCGGPPGIIGIAGACAAPGYFCPRGSSSDTQHPCDAGTLGPAPPYLHANCSGGFDGVCAHHEIVEVQLRWGYLVVANSANASS